MTAEVTATTVKLLWSKPSLCEHYYQLDAFNFTLAFKQGDKIVQEVVPVDNIKTTYECEISDLLPNTAFKASVYAANRIGNGEKFFLSKITPRESRK